MKPTLWKLFSLWVMISAPIGVMAQGEVNGTVKEADTGMPLPGVNVVIKGTTTGTVTDFDGNYQISVSDFPATLVFSSLGYSAIAENVSGATTLNIVMVQDVTGLEEVVVTGLATSIKRANSANAVSSISAEELVGVAQPQTLDGALAGKFTGALVSANSGAPGGGLSVKLRGVTSIFGNSQPLYIVDGVYVDNSSISSGLNDVSGAAGQGSSSNQDNPSNRIADLDPNDIKNIEILKGASAAAIYGSRAAAGVVIISTKRGSQGKTRFNLSQSFGFNSVINLLGLREWNEERALDAFGEGADVAYAEARDAGTLTDYEKEIFDNKGFISSTGFSASGGGEKTTFYAGMSHKNEKGIVKNTGYERVSLRLNLDHKVSDRIKLSLNSNYIYSSADRGFFNNDNTGSTIGVTLTSLPPWAQLQPDAEGNYPDNLYGGSNPLQTIALMTNNEKVNRFIVGGSATIDIYKSLKSDLQLILRGGLDSYNLNTRAIFPKELQFEKRENGGLNGQSIQGSTENKNINYSAFLVHNFNTDSNINFRTQAGMTREAFDRNSYLISAFNMIASETNVDQAGGQRIDQFRLKQEDSGFFVQEEVNFQDKLIGTIGLRGDKSSNNGDANKLYYYPKASLAANLHEFGFWNLGNVNQLKLRAAYGEAGNFPTFGSPFTSFNSTFIRGVGDESVVGILLDGVLGNPDIEPERQKELELGLDLGLFDNRVNLEFTWYNKKVDDLLVQTNREPSSGFTTEWKNAGNLKNTGIEISLNARPVESEDFMWNSNTTFFKNKSKITELNVPAFNLGAFGASLGTYRIEEGKSATQIVGISPDGLVKFGDGEPDFQMTFNNNLQYKDLEFSFLFHWKKGGDNINLTTLLTDLSKTSHDYDDFGLDPAGTVPNGEYRAGQVGTSADVFVEDASYLKLREVGLYYNFPNALVERWFDGYIANIKLGFTGTNLLTFFDYNSYDPEVSNFGGNGLSSGVDVTPFPSSRRYMFNLSVDF